MSENSDTPTPAAIQRFRDALRSHVAPVREQLDEMEAEITAREEELAELRKARTEARHVLYTIDPESRPKPKTQAKKSGSHNVAPARVDAVEAWLRENIREGERFSNASINNGRPQTGFDVVPEGTLTFAIKALHERGAIRFDRIGDRGAKLYTLV